MTVQIFGKSKCFDTKKAERYFKERSIKIQMIDLPRYGISKGELNSVMQAIGGVEKLVDPKSPDASLLTYLAYEQDKVDKLLENPKILRTPIVRFGKKATLGYAPEVWKTWED